MSNNHPVPDELDQAALKPVFRKELFTIAIPIDSMELWYNHGIYWVRTRSGGAEGVAPANKRAAYLYPILQELVIPYFIGKDARDIETLIDGVYLHKSNYKLSGLALWNCVAYAEASILDLLGRIADQPVGTLLGGVVRDEVAIYVASGRRDTSPHEEVELLQKRIAETGATAVKFKVGGRMSKNADSIPGRTEGLIQLSRKELGDGITIHADANGSYYAPKAIEIGRMLEEINAYFFEEPCPFDDPDETKKVADALTIPVVAGEQETSLRRFKWLIQNKALRTVQPDLQYNGGFIRTIRVARMADVAGLPITLHIASGMSYLPMLHFASCTPNIGKFQELKKGVEETGVFFEPQLTIDKGRIRIPKGPGLGIADPGYILKDAKKIESQIRFSDD